MKNLALTRAQKAIEQELMFSGEGDSGERWFAALSQHINNMILYEFPKLVEVLYRLDVNEGTLTQLLKDSPEADAGSIIGALIIQRQLQKIKTRDEYHKDGSDIDEKDKW